MSTAKMDQALARAFKATVTDNRELHGPASDRSCRHIELDVKGKGVQCEPHSFPQCNFVTLRAGTAPATTSPSFPATGA